MGKTMKRDLVPSQTSDPEVFQGDVINPYEYDYDYNREQRGKILDTINSAVAIEKTNAAIAKKEVDTSAYATKTHVDSERAYIDSLLKEKDRKGITPEELAILDEKIEAAQIRLQESERESRRQVDESLYQKPTNVWGVVIGCILSFLAGGWFASFRRAA
ncbi:MAG: hypothetical protein K6G34_09935 [Lachnospiraceae bacterium]|nr:hypothetical protein [Lachnospiraceae bacterium]